MKNLIRTTTLFALALIIALPLHAQKTLPDIQVTSLDGKRVTISDHAKNGKITVVSFWATWCSPCKRELDAISEVYGDWEELYGAELVAISVDNTRSVAKVAPMVAQKGWEYDIYLDSNQELQKSLNFQTVPQTFILDKEGNIVYEHSGYVPGDEYELEEKLEELAKK
jgi:peroxiredoxin